MAVQICAAFPRGGEQGEAFVGACVGLVVSSAVRMLQTAVLGKDRRTDGGIRGWEHKAGLLPRLPAMQNSWDMEGLLCGDQLSASCLFLGWQILCYARGWLMVRGVRGRLCRAHLRSSATGGVCCCHLHRSTPGCPCITERRLSISCTVVC